MEMGRNKTYKSLMTLGEAILLIDGTFDGYYECMEYRKKGNKRLYPKTTMKADKKALIAKIKEWEYKARMYDMENESQKEVKK